MEPRKDELKMRPSDGKQQSNRRFRIVKLEERIAPCNSHLNPHGKEVGLGNCGRNY